MGMAPLQNAVKLMVNDVKGQEKQRDSIIQKANIDSFQGPTASFAIQQGVFCTI